MQIPKLSCCRYFYERAWWGLQRALAGRPAAVSTATAPTLPDAKPPVISPQAAGPIEPPKPGPSPAKQAETLDPGVIPKEPQGEEADKLHQYKKEASSQQSP